MSAQVPPNANPNAFYTELVTAPYVNNAIISTHIYGPSVTHAMTNFSGAGLDWRLSVSFGKKTLYVRRCACARVIYPSQRDLSALPFCTVTALASQDAVCPLESLLCEQQQHRVCSALGGCGACILPVGGQLLGPYGAMTDPACPCPSLQGYTTAGGVTRKFPAILGEFGSFMNNSQDSCFIDNCIVGEGDVRNITSRRTACLLFIRWLKKLPLSRCHAQAPPDM